MLLHPRWAVRTLREILWLLIMACRRRALLVRRRIFELIVLLLDFLREGKECLFARLGEFHGLLLHLRKGIVLRALLADGRVRSVGRWAELRCGSILRLLLSTPLSGGGVLLLLCKTSSKFLNKSSEKEAGTYSLGARTSSSWL